MFFAEDIICKVADYLNIHVDEIRRINFFKVGDRLPYSICDKSILTDEHIIQGRDEHCITGVINYELYSIPFKAFMKNVIEILKQTSEEKRLKNTTKKTNGRRGD